MSFRKPGGNLTFLSLFWLVGGIAGVAYSFEIQSTLLFILCLVGLVATVGLWFQSYTARNFLIAWFGIALCLAVVLVVYQGITLRAVFRVVFAAYCVYTLYRWPEEEE